MYENCDSVKSPRLHQPKTKHIPSFINQASNKSIQESEGSKWIFSRVLENSNQIRHFSLKIKDKEKLTIEAMNDLKQKLVEILIILLYH